MSAAMDHIAWLSLGADQLCRWWHVFLNMVLVPTGGEILFARDARKEALEGDLLGRRMHCRFQDLMTGLETSWRRCSKRLALCFCWY